MIEWIQSLIDFPPQFEFFLYLGATVLLVGIFIVTVDLFLSILFSIFKRR